MFFFSFSQTHALCMSWPPSRRSAHRLSMFQNPAKLPIFQQIAVHCKHASLTFHCFGYSIAMIAISRLFRTATCQQLLERDVRGKLDQLLTPKETMHKSKQKKDERNRRENMSSITAAGRPVVRLRLSCPELNSVTSRAHGGPMSRARSMTWTPEDR